MTRMLAGKLVVALVLAAGLGCAGSRERSSPEEARVDRCSNGAAGGAVSHDEAREMHQGGPPVGGYHTAGYGTRSDADRPPEWWGRGDDRVEPCGEHDERPALSGPLLLDASNPRQTEPPPVGDDAAGDVAP